MTPEEIEVLKKKVLSITNRAKAHGVDLKPGEDFLVVATKFLDRLDLYRDAPLNKGRIIVE